MANKYYIGQSAPQLRVALSQDIPALYAAVGGTAGNPTASIGLAVVNGVATTFMRSDAAPALNQGIAPTWTAAHIFSALATFNGLVAINAVSGQTPLTVGWLAGQPSILAGNITCDEPAVPAGSGAVNYGGTTAATATAGTSGAPPAQVAGYIIINVAGTNRKLPFYAT